MSHTIAESARVSIDARLLSGSHLTIAARRDLRDKILIEFIESREYGSRMQLLEIAELLRLGQGHSDQVKYAAANRFITEAIERGIITKEYLGPATTNGFTLYAQSPVVTTKLASAQTPKQPRVFSHVSTIDRDKKLVQYFESLHTTSIRMTGYHRETLIDLLGYRASPDSNSVISNYFRAAADRGVVVIERHSNTTRSRIKYLKLPTNYAAINFKDEPKEETQPMQAPSNNGSAEALSPAMPVWPDEAKQVETLTVEKLQEQAIAYAWQHPESAPHLREFINYLKENPGT